MYLISKHNLKTHLIEQLATEVTGYKHAFFTKEMNQTFIENTPAIQRDYFFELIKDCHIPGTDFYELSSLCDYQQAFCTMLAIVKKDLKLRGEAA